MVSFKGLFACFILWLWCRSRDLLFFACFTFMVMVSFKGSFVCLFYLDSYCFIFLFVFTFIVMVSFKGSFVVCLFYLYSYGVVQGIFCFLLVLPWWLWCRSRDLLLFACFTFMVMVSFKGSFVVCLFYLYGYGVVQGIFCCLIVLPLWLWCRSRDLLLFFVLPLWLWCRSRDLLLFVCFTLIVMVSFKGSFVVSLFYLYGYGVVQGIFCCLLVLPWWLWCRSMDLLLFVCFTLMVMVSFKGSFVVCLFYLYGYGVVQGIFCCLLVLPWCYGVVQWILMVMVSFKGSFVVCLFYLDGYGVVQWIFCCLLVLPGWLWCRSRDLLLFVCFIFIVMVSFNGSFVVCLYYLYSYGVVQWIFCCLFVLPL